MKAKTTISMFLKVDLQHGQDRRCLSEPLRIEMSPIGTQPGPEAAVEETSAIAPLLGISGRAPNGPKMAQMTISDLARVRMPE